MQVTRRSIIFDALGRVYPRLQTTISATSAQVEIDAMHISRNKIRTGA